MNRWKTAVLGVVLLCLGCAPSYYQVAEKHVKKQEYDQAIRAYIKILDPHIRNGKRYIYYDKEVVTRIGIVFDRIQRYDTAAKILGMVVQKDPTFGKALFYLGLSHEGLGRDEEALRIYQEYSQLAPLDPYRQVLVGRKDYLVRRIITREIQMALRKESELALTEFPEKSLAVLYFLSLSEDKQWEPLQKGIAEMLVTDLSQIEELKVVERLRLQFLMDELRLGPEGLTDEGTAPRLGKLLGTRNLIKGSFMVTPSMKLTLDAGVFAVGSLGPPAMNNFDGNLTRLFQMEKELVLRILDYFKIEISPEKREKLIQIPTQNLVAFLSYCNGLDAWDRGDFRAASSFFQEALRLDPQFQLARDYLVPSVVWESTHVNNLVRVDYEIAQTVRTGPYAEEALPGDLVEISPLIRLQTMGIHQNAGFLPGNDTRRSFEEADQRGAPVLPQILGEPPWPPSRR